MGIRRVRFVSLYWTACQQLCFTPSSLYNWLLVKRLLIYVLGYVYVYFLICFCKCCLVRTFTSMHAYEHAFVPFNLVPVYCRSSYIAHHITSHHIKSHHITSLMLQRCSWVHTRSLLAGNEDSWMYSGKDTVLIFTGRLCASSSTTNSLSENLISCL